MGAALAYETSPQLVWVPLTGNSADVFREGMIISNIIANAAVTHDGFSPLGAAVGLADVTAKKVPFGIIEGFNTYPGTETYDSTYHTQSMTSIASASIHGATAQYLGGQSEHTSFNDGTAKALVALLDPCSYIRMPIYNATFGTAITVGTVTAAGASLTGAGFTSSACCDVAGVDGMSTVYCRKGANMGTYRVTSDTSTTVKTVYDYFRYDVAAGDQFVGVPFKLGLSYIQFTSESCFINAAATPATNTYSVVVVEMNLKEAGNEYAIFRFTPDQFCWPRP